MMAALAGRADICEMLAPGHFATCESAGYLLDEERVLCVLRSVKDEYAITSLCLLHVDGDSAVSKKREVKRYPWHSHAISGVEFETAGNVDRDVEICFNLGGHHFEIDVRKDQAPQLRWLYKALVAAAEAQADHGVHLKNAATALDVAKEAVRAAGPSATPGAALTEASRAAMDWLTAAHREHGRADLGPVLWQYLARAFPVD